MPLATFLLADKGWGGRNWNRREGNVKMNSIMIAIFSLQPRKIKNISHDAFGSKLGRIHMTKQDLSKLQTRKMKGLKKRPFESSEEAAETSGTETTSPVAKKAKQTAT